MERRKNKKVNTRSCCHEWIALYQHTEVLFFSGHTALLESPAPSWLVAHPQVDSTQTQVPMPGHLLLCHCASRHEVSAVSHQESISHHSQPSIFRPQCWKQSLTLE